MKRENKTIMQISLSCGVYILFKEQLVQEKHMVKVIVSVLLNLLGLCYADL